MIIAGAGLAGLLAGNMLSLAHKPKIYETQPALPNNHSAVLRFRTGAVGDVVGIPFKKVTVIKAVLPWRNPVADALSYSFKNGGIRRSDRSIIRGDEIAERFIAPSDLIQRLASRLPDINFDQSAWRNMPVGVPIISTIPMPALMETLGYPAHKRPKFGFRSGINLKAQIADCDAYVSLAVPDPTFPFTRLSITGSELIAEFTGCSEQEKQFGSMRSARSFATCSELIFIKRQAGKSSLRNTRKSCRSMRAPVASSFIGRRRSTTFIPWAASPRGDRDCCLMTSSTTSG